MTFRRWTQYSSPVMNDAVESLAAASLSLSTFACDSVLTVSVLSMILVWKWLILIRRYLRESLDAAEALSGHHLDTLDEETRLVKLIFFVLTPWCESRYGDNLPEQCRFRLA